MSGPDTLARRRWLAMVTSRIAGSLGAVFGLLLAARAPDSVTKALGIAITLSALVVIAVVPRGLAERWRSPRP